MFYFNLGTKYLKIFNLAKKLSIDMSEISKIPELPITPIQGANMQGAGIGGLPAGWYQNEFLPWNWMENQEMHHLLQYGIGMCLLFGISIILGLGFDKYRDQIQDVICKMVQAIKEKIMTILPGLSNPTEISDFGALALILVGILFGLSKVLTASGHFYLVIDQV